MLGWLQSLVMVVVKAENPASQSYVDGKSNSVFSATVASSGYSVFTLIQKHGIDCDVNKVFHHSSIIHNFSNLQHFLFSVICPLFLVWEMVIQKQWLMYPFLPFVFRWEMAVKLYWDCNHYFPSEKDPRIGREWIRDPFELHKIWQYLHRRQAWIAQITVFCVFS